MDIKKIKNELEKYFCIGFDVDSNANFIIISPKNSMKENFHIVIENRSNIRLLFKAEPEEYGANFIKLLNNSTKQKRINCCNLKDNTKIVVNNIELEIKEFINDTQKWNSFCIITEVLPYNGNDEIVIDKAKCLISMMLSLIDYSIEGEVEGNKEEVISTRYERNPINRRICLNANGYKCVICGFDFEKVYGEFGKNTIEVHHTIPVSKMGKDYVVNPINELVPVCSNCHTIIHKRKIPYTINEVKEMIDKQKT